MTEAGDALNYSVLFILMPHNIKWALLDPFICFSKVYSSDKQ